MPHRSDLPERRIRAGRWLLAGGMTAALIAMPVASQHDSFGVVWQTALARGAGGGHGGGPGGGPGGDHGRGGEAPGRGIGAAARDAAASHGRAGSDYGSFREFAESVRGATGRALGPERRDGRLEQARARYTHALDQRRGRGPNGASALGLERRPGALAHRLSPQETRHLIEHGWRPGREPGPGFRNHGERVRTMVELSKRLGHGAQVGALQANFGTPQETGIAELETELAMARAELDASPEDPEAAAWVDQLELELAVAIENAKPGQGPTGSWASADLDVNHDGVVDPHDLADLDAGQATMPAGYVGSLTGR